MKRIRILALSALLLLIPASAQAYSGPFHFVNVAEPGLDWWQSDRCTEGTWEWILHVYRDNQYQGPHTAFCGPLNTNVGWSNLCNVPLTGDNDPTGFCPGVGLHEFAANRITSIQVQIAPGSGKFCWYDHPNYGAPVYQQGRNVDIPNVGTSWPGANDTFQSFRYIDSGNCSA